MARVKEICFYVAVIIDSLIEHHERFATHLDARKRFRNCIKQYANNKVTENELEMAERDEIFTFDDGTVNLLSD